MRVKDKGNITILITSLLFVIVFLSALLLVSLPHNDEKIYCLDDETRMLLQEVYPELEFESINNSSLSYFENGKSIVTNKENAQQIIEANDNYVFIPQYKETVIIAIDRDLTDEYISDFNDLFTKEASFFLGDKTALNVWGNDSFAIYLSLAYGLYGHYDIKSLAKEFDILEEKGSLFINEDKPFMVMTDRQAVSLIKEGRNLEIVVPSCGTHTFVYGILTNKNIKTNDTILNKELIENGYMTRDNAKDSYYPSIDEYSNASEVVDINAYNDCISNCGKIIRRDVFDTKRFGCANNSERGVIFVVLSSLVVVYMMSLGQRVQQINIRNAIKITNVAQIGLMGTFVIRMMFNGDFVLSTMLWYLYYVFFGLLSLSFFYIALNIGRHKNNRYKKIFLVYSISIAICILLVLTNNLHEQVFNFIYIDNGQERYDYNWGYYLTACIIYIPVFVSIVIMIYKAHKSPRKFAMVFPCLAVVFLLTYGILYILNISLGRDLDIAFGATIFSLLIMESCLLTGLVPINVGYNKLFKESKLKMQIKSNNELPFIDYNNESDDVEVVINKLPSGEFLYYKDIKEINNVKKQIASAVSKLQDNNDKLLREQEIKKELAKTTALEETYRQINEIIKEDKLIIIKLLEEMEKSIDKETYIARINILAVGIKRKSMLKVGSVDEYNLDVNILHASIDEISQFTSKINCNFSSICRLKNWLPSKEKILEIYSAYLKIIDNALIAGTNLIFVQIYEENGYLVFSIITDKLISINIESTMVNNVHFKQKMWEDNTVTLLSIKGDDNV